MSDEQQVVKVVCADCGKVVLEMNKLSECLNHFCHVNNIIAPAKYTGENLPDFLECDCKNVLGVLAADPQSVPAYYLIAGKYRLATR
ncbi:MAG: hypothetical protein WC080_04645 [Patescibacteria group bacterium]|jgi:hypothetical protein